MKPKTSEDVDAEAKEIAAEFGIGPREWAAMDEAARTGYKLLAIEKILSGHAKL